VGKRTIEIPLNKMKRLSGFAIRRTAIRGESGGLFPSLTDYDIRYSENTVEYFPYWIGRIRTSKIRFLLSPKIIDFFVVCNAYNGKYLVMRAMPKTKKVEADEVHIIEDDIPQTEFERQIMPESLEKHIHRQFIFGGATEADILDSKLVYIPVKEVEIRKHGSKTYNAYYINMYTGRLEGN
jgi:hypothetical protein